ncbi:unnamed protein product [Trichobilharzia regenti]|uniref:Uncharacterized protein n=1 Tax=Trichobilharzia regenti TaxID=157069 RepID=A0A183WUS3_TRIRE|nr:unnamed protein product [Trichobilharzia regenti]VDQ11756.1 unnamed protein product [Trichobilharzia regenti]
MKISVVFVCILQLILVKSQENEDATEDYVLIIPIDDTVPKTKNTDETTPGTSTTSENTPGPTTAEETTPEPVTTSGTTSGAETKTTVTSSTMETSVPTRKPDDSKDKGGESVILSNGIHAHTALFA